MNKAQKLLDLCEQDPPGGPMSGTGGMTGPGGTAGVPGSMTGSGIPGSGKAAVEPTPSRFFFRHGQLPRCKVGFHYDIEKGKCVKDKA